MDGSIATKATVLKVVRGENRHSIILLAVKLGIPESDKSLNGILLAYGDKELARSYLISGSDSLREGARHWLRSHGYETFEIEFMGSIQSEK